MTCSCRHQQPSYLATAQQRARCVTQRSAAAQAASDPEYCYSFCHWNHKILAYDASPVRIVREYVFYIFTDPKNMTFYVF